MRYKCVNVRFFPNEEVKSVLFLGRAVRILSAKRKNINYSATIRSEDVIFAAWVMDVLWMWSLNTVSLTASEIQTLLADNLQWDWLQLHRSPLDEWMDK